MGKLIPAGTGSPLYQGLFAVESELLEDVKTAMVKEETLLAEQKAEADAEPAPAEVPVEAAAQAEGETPTPGEVTT